MKRFLLSNLWVAVVALSVSTLGCSEKKSEAPAEAKSTAAPAAGSTASSNTSQNTGGNAAQSATSPKSAKPSKPFKLELAEVLSSKTTLGFIGITGIPEAFQFIDTQLGQVLTSVPANMIPSDAKPFFDKAARQALIGFDIASVDGWNKIGVDIAAGIYFIFDDTLSRGNEPIPVIALKMTDRKKLLEFVKSKGLPVPTFAPKNGASEVVTIDGETGLIGTMKGYTFIYGRNLSSSKGGEEQAAFNRFLKGDGSNLKGAGVVSKALSSGSGSTRFFGFLNTEGFGAKIDALPAEAKQIVRFIADRFPGAGISTRVGGASFKVVAREDAIGSLKKILRPQTAPKMAQYIPKSGWLAARFSINLATLFQGVSEFIPPANFQMKMAVMSAPMMLQGVGLDWAAISDALDGHVMVGLSAQAIGSFAKTQSIPDGAFLALGVKDEAKADRLLNTLVELLKKQGPPAIESSTVAGQPGYVIKAGPINPVVVRMGKAIFIAPSASAVETAQRSSKGVNLSSLAAGRALDDHDACVVYSVDVANYLSIMADMLAGIGDPATATASTAMKAAVAKQKGSADLQAAVLLDGGLEFRVDGLDKMLPLIIDAVKAVIPTVLK